jgi:hypothetical protein
MVNGYSIGTMPSYGTETIDGIPVLVREGVLYAFQPGMVGSPPIRLGTYTASTKKAVWESQELNTWLTSYKSTLVARSRKV